MKKIYLSQIYVTEKWRKKGIFKELLKELICREKECHFITNLVGNENKVMMHALNKMQFKSCDLITYYKKI